MRFVTWNLSHAVKRGTERRKRAWEHLARLGADVALVQEAGLPVVGGAANVVGRNKEGADWGPAVVSYGPPLREIDQPIRPSWNRNATFNIPRAARHGTLAVAVVTAPDGKPVVAVSLYGKLRYADQSVLRAASDLLPLFDTPLATRVIVGGDLNIHTHSGAPAERRRAGPILAVLESFGLVDLVRDAKAKGVLRQGDQAHLQACPCGLADCSHVRTHRHGKHLPGTMANNDYLFATDALVHRLELVTINNGDTDVAWQHSDHAPIIADFQL